MDSEVREVPQFIPSGYKSTKHIGYSFACDTPNVWSELQDDIRLPHLSFRKKLEAYVFTKTYPP